MRKRRIYESSMSHLPNDDIYFVENAIIRLFDNIYETQLFLSDCYIPGIGTVDYISVNNNQLEVVDRDGHYIMLSDLTNKDWDILFYGFKEAAQHESGMNRIRFGELCDKVYNEEKLRTRNDGYTIMENKKSLYEKIMRNVSKEVKHALTETTYSKMFSKGTHFIENAIAKLITGEGVSSVYLENFNIGDFVQIERVEVIDGELELIDPTGDFILMKSLTEGDLEDLFYAVRSALYDITDKTPEELNLHSIKLYFDEKKKYEKRHNV